MKITTIKEVLLENIKSFSSVIEFFNKNTKDERMKNILITMLELDMKKMSAKNLTQTVKHILQKAFFKHILV